ncbi:MAG: DUF433 domain-containing protein [Chloroflexi bacterium]|nr:DUF433 domain-containing protein [Chloroflexota bacterium]
MALKTARVSIGLKSYIVKTPGVAGGRPRIAGHRIRVQDVAMASERMGLSPDEIADEYELTLGEVYAALSYYFDHRAEIRRNIERDRKYAAGMKRGTPSLLRAKLKEMRA